MAVFVFILVIYEDAVSSSGVSDIFGNFQAVLNYVKILSPTRHTSCVRVARE